MKAVKSYVVAYRWQLLVVSGLLLSNITQAAPHSVSPVAQAACESHAIAIYKKKAVEIEMSSIAGNVNEMELASTRESLQERLRHEREDCTRVARVSASIGGRL